MHSFKVISSAVILLLAVFGFSYYSNHILKTTSNKIEVHINDIEKNIEGRKWELLKEQLDNLEQDWHDIEKTWAILIDHFEIDNIDNSFTRMTKFIEAKDYAPALAEAGALKQFIKHIPEKDSLSIKNVF